MQVTTPRSARIHPLAAGRKIANLWPHTEQYAAIESDSVTIQTKRAWSCLLALILMCAAPLAHAQQSAFSVVEPSAAGSYLAGQEALRELHTGDAARFFLDASSAQWESPTVVARAFEVLAADGRIEDAEPIARHLLELEPESELAHVLLGTIALKERRYTSAVNQLEPVGSQSFIGITATILHAWALIGQDDYEGAQALLDEMGRSGLEDFLVFHRALMADVTGNADAAIGYARTAYENDKYVARIIEAYVRMLANDKRFDEARQVIADYRAEGLSHPVIGVLSERVENGTRPGKMATSVQQGAAEMFHGIGAALSRDGSADISMVFLRLGLYLEPRSEVISLALGDLLESRGNYEAANDIYESLPNDSVLKTQAMIRVAENLDAAGDRTEAIRRLGNIVATNPGNVDAISVLGDLYRYDEQYSKAIDAYTRTLELAGAEGDRPRDWRFYYVRGIAYERADQWPKAEADFQKALELNPGHPQVLNYLGYSWVDQGIHLEQALEMIREAVNARPSDGYIVDSLGWAYYKLGRIEEAVQTLEQAVRLLPNDPEINDHLGDAYWQAGRRLEARFQWNIASDVDEENGDVTQRANLKLAEGLDAVQN